MRDEKSNYVHLVQFEGDELGDGGELLGFVELFNFGIGSAVLAKEHEFELDNIAGLLNDTGYFAEVIGQASRSGARAFNQKLSTNRMFNCVERLIAAGTNASQIMRIDATGEDGWKASGVKDGTENPEHRCVNVVLWTRSPYNMTVGYRRTAANRMKMKFTKTA